MTVLRASVFLILGFVAFSGNAAQASSLGRIGCTVIGVRYGKASGEKLAPLPVIDSKTYRKSCPVFPDPEFGSVGECVFNVGRLKIAVRTLETEFDMSVESSPIKAETDGTGGATLSLWDDRHNTKHTVICSIQP